MFFRF
jgi:hypothetical protein